MTYETPSPVTGTVTVESDAVTGWDFPRELVWLSEAEAGDMTNHIRNNLLANHGVGIEATVTVVRDGEYHIENAHWIEDTKAQ